MIDDAPLEKTEAAQGNDLTQLETREPEQPAQTDGQELPRGRQWISSLPQVACEDSIHIGNGRYAHFRRDRRFAQVQLAFTAPEGVDPNPGRELTDQFKELGWTCDGRQLYIPPDDNWISRSGLTRSQVNDN